MTAQQDPQEPRDSEPPPAPEGRLSEAIERAMRSTTTLARSGREPEEPEEPSALDAIRDPEEFQRRRLSSLLDRAIEQLPERYRWASFDSMMIEERVTPATKVPLARSYVGRDVLLWGPSQTGKTTLACAILRELVEIGRKALDEKRDAWKFRRALGIKFVTAYDLARASHQSSLGAQPELVGDALNASVLVIDDLGMDARVNQGSAAVVREVIHDRHARERPMVLTSYASAADITAHYGAGISKRLQHSGVITLGAGVAR